MFTVCSRQASKTVVWMVRPSRELKEESPSHRINVKVSRNQYLSACFTVSNLQWNRENIISGIQHNVFLSVFLVVLQGKTGKWLKTCQKQRIPTHACRDLPKSWLPHHPVLQSWNLLLLSERTWTENHLLKVIYFVLQLKLFTWSCWPLQNPPKRRH